MKLKISLLVVSLMLCGCEDKKCIKSHTELKPMFLPTGSGNLKMVMMPTNVCDEWEEK